MRILLTTLLVFLITALSHGQRSIDRTLKKFNKESVPYISVEELANLGQVVLLDTREAEEYKVSHLEGAMLVGHKNFKIDSVTAMLPDKNSEIIVYCSIGVRSENIGEKLQKAGYTNVKNLYGGIFEWKNRGYPIYGPQKMETDSIHAFNKHWGKLLTNGEKVYNRDSDTTTSKN